MLEIHFATRYSTGIAFVAGQNYRMRHSDRFGCWKGNGKSLSDFEIFEFIARSLYFSSCRMRMKSWIYYWRRRRNSENKKATIRRYGFKFCTFFVYLQIFISGFLHDERMGSRMHDFGQRFRSVFAVGDASRYESGIVQTGSGHCGM